MVSNAQANASDPSYSEALYVECDPDPNQDADARAVLAILERIDLAPEEKQALVGARRGQGLFRARVIESEMRCRVTGVDEAEHLCAHHIKPWRDSTDMEKLDGNNGLLLAPHIDHLFDQGYISFWDSGQLILSVVCPTALIEAWGIDTSVSPRSFRPAQLRYLAYHRAQVLRQ